MGIEGGREGAGSVRGERGTVSSAYLVLLYRAVLFLLGRRLPGDQDGGPIGVALCHSYATWGPAGSCGRGAKSHRERERVRERERDEN